MITDVIGSFLIFSKTISVCTIRAWMGGNGIAACFIAALVGTIFYMPTLLEVPIVGTILGYKAGVIGAGPTLALLLAGLGVSLPSLLVTRGILSTKKTMTYTSLVVFYSALAGFIFGNM